jgi:hypothetical protein
MLSAWALVVLAALASLGSAYAALRLARRPRGTRR